MFSEGQKVVFNPENLQMQSQLHPGTRPNVPPNGSIVTLKKFMMWKGKPYWMIAGYEFIGIREQFLSELYFKPLDEKWAENTLSEVLKKAKEAEKETHWVKELQPDHERQISNA